MLHGPQWNSEKNELYWEHMHEMIWRMKITPKNVSSRGLFLSAQVLSNSPLMCRSLENSTSSTKVLNFPLNLNCSSTSLARFTGMWNIWFHWHSPSWHLEKVVAWVIPSASTTIAASKNEQNILIDITADVKLCDVLILCHKELQNCTVPAFNAS